MLYIFDMGGVVTTTFREENIIAKKIGVSPEVFRAVCGDESSGLFADLTCGRINAREFWAEFGRRCGITVKADWFHLVFHPVLNEGTCAVISALKKMGHRVVCGTNTVEPHYMNHVERGDYCFFDQTYASHFMGVAKPDPAFWQLILDIENVPVSQAVFIDDKKVNCDAAAKLGIKAVLFTDALSLARELGVSL